MEPFKGNDYPTVGVEQEFHLIDPETADLAPAMAAVRDRLTGRLAESITHELFLSVLESRSIVARTIDQLHASLAADRRELAGACRSVGVVLAAAGSHPFARWQDQIVDPSEHYLWVQREHGYLADRLLAFGLHIHVGIRSGQAAIYVMDEMRRWVYPLLAMAANSPYYEGVRTGLASTRCHLFGSMPRTTLPPRFDDLDQLADLYEKLRAAGDINRPGDLWWMVRPQLPLGTVELRVFDLPTDLGRLAVLAAIAQAACATYQDRFEMGLPAATLQEPYLDQNRWKAMRYDLDAGIIEPQTGEILTTRDQLGRLLDLVAPKAAQLGSQAYIAEARRMLEGSAEWRQQIEITERCGGDLRQLELELARRTVPPG